MEAALVTTILTPLVQKLFAVGWENCQLRDGIGDNISYIQRKLPVVYAHIETLPADAECQQDQRLLLDELLELAHEMEYHIGLFIHGQALKCQRSLTLRLRHCSTRAQFARQIKNLKDRLDNTLMNSQELRLRSDDDPSDAFGPEEPGSPAEGAIRGINGPLGHLLAMLVQPEQNLKLISVVGPGGVGKTLLARLAYESALSQQEFDEKAWVRAADTSDEASLIRAILIDIGVQQDEMPSSNDSVIMLLRSHLTTKRYLIVIDDVRNLRWSNFESVFIDEQVGSRIIVTTTQQSIANDWSSGSSFVYKMRPLGSTSDDSKSLFFGEVSQTRPPHWDDAMVLRSDGILRKCEGLPLALVSIGRYIRSKGGMDACADACDRLCHHLEREPTLARMHWVLARSYSNLPDSVVKACLLYFCMFDGPIERDSLIRRWLAEGFAEQARPQLGNPQSYGNEILKTLINVNIIETTAVNDYGEVKSCKPPGMVQEYITFKSMVDKFVAFPNQTPLPEYSRRLPFRGFRGNLNRSILQRVRTLAVSGRACEAVRDFDKCDLVRVLDLEDCNNLNNSHVKKICDLLLLRYLSLGGQRITKVPRKIARLQWLETLDIRNTGIHLVPKEVIKLPLLKYLLGRRFRLQDTGNERELRKFLEDKSILETLAGFVVTGSTRGFPQLIHCMCRLMKVKICCDQDSDGKNLTDLSEAIAKFIGQEGTPNPEDRSLSIDFQECRSFNLPDAPHGSLGSLKLSGNLSSFRQFVTNLIAITELRLISSTMTWNYIIDCLSCLGTLENLKLVADEIQCEMHNIVIQPEHLKSLKRMVLMANQGVHTITIQQDQDAQRKLVSLHLICRDLDGLSSDQILQLRQLEEVALHSQLDGYKKEAWKQAGRNHPNRPNILFKDPRPLQNFTTRRSTLEKHMYAWLKNKIRTPMICNRY